jgi:thiamine biosynthesis protein ThiS
LIPKVEYVSRVNIQLNNKLTGVRISIEHLIIMQGISSKEVTVALDGSVVTKSEWKTTIINENNNLIIITATQGG